MRRRSQRGGFNVKRWNVQRVRKDAISITVDFSLRAATAYPASLIESFLFFPSLTPGVREGKKRADSIREAGQASPSVD